jgi:hypothetical protein
LKKYIIHFSAAVIVALVAGRGDARDLGVLVLPVHQGKFTSSLLYEHLKVQDDFDSRGRADFKSDVVGAVFSYGITDKVAVGIKGGSILEPTVEAQGSQWKSRAGYLYGIDLYNEVFPATPGLRPGVQLSGGVTGFMVPLDRTNFRISTPGIPGDWQSVDQTMSGIEYHGAVVATFKAGPAEPYAGVRGFGSSVTWKDNQANPGSIKGHAHGNISLVAGLPIQISKDVRFEVEGRFVNETAVTAGFTVAVF